MASARRRTECADSPGEVLSVPMSNEDTKGPSERFHTDTSLRVERAKTDSELGARLGNIEDDADAAVRVGRERADSALDDARQREDASIRADGPSAQRLDAERNREDAAIDEERKADDASLDDERMRRHLALARLLASEREDTDARLLTERLRADASLTARDDFLAIVSHDLRSLLGGIALSASLLQRQAKDDAALSKTTRHTQGIQRMTVQMTRLIGDLLDVASIEAGKVLVMTGRHDAALLVRDAADAFESVVSAKDIAFTVDAPKESLPTDFDPERILQVLSNLLGNALKFTSKGGRITLRVEARGNDVCFSVTDTGEGISADKLQMIFERFSQGRSNDRRGLGLGLFIAKHIIEAHGGKIWVESRPGHGSTFFFTLPAPAR
jgi:signal transduction histidine kinase